MCPVDLRRSTKARRAIKGHEFGLKLSPEEGRDLIAFLRTL
jgi:hypothetical protein